MKNRRNVLVAFLLLAVLCIGIGFAALTDPLTIGGSIAVKANAGEGEDLTPNEEAWDEDVYFANAGANPTVTGTWASRTGKGTATITIDTNDNDKATISIPNNVLSLKGDTVTFTIDIKNDNDEYNASIDIPEVQTITDETSGGQFKITVTGASTVNKNSSATYSVKVEVIKTPTSNINAKTFTLTFTATTAS